MATAQDFTGRKVGAYELIRVIGRGGMATVYEARHAGTGRMAAVKIPADFLVEDPKLLRKFFDEARFASRVHHPSVVEVFEAGSDGDTPFIAMELLQGPTIARVIRRQRRMDVGQAIEVARQTAAALAHIHAQHVHHKDIKPKNLTIEPDGRVKIMDFGIANLGYWNIEEMEGSHGTPAYLAPEQALGLPTDHRMDIYALGVTLFEMIAGRKPFQAPSAVELRRKITDTAIPSIRGLNHHASPAVEAIIERATAKSPEDRYQTAAEMERDLARALSEWEKAQNISVKLNSLAPAVPAAGIVPPNSSAAGAEAAVAAGASRAGRAARRTLRVGAIVFIAFAGAALLAALTLYARLWFAGDLIAAIPAHKRDVNTVAFLIDQDRLMTAGADGYLRIWSIGEMNAPGGALAEWRADEGNAPAAAPVSAGRILASCAKKNAVSLWESRSKKRTWTQPTESPIQSMATFAGGRRVLAGGAEGAVLIFDMDPPAQIGAFTGHRGVVYALDVSRNESMALSGDGEGGLALWRIDPIETIHAWKGHKGKIRATAISPSGEVGLSGGPDGEIKIWNLGDAKLLGSLKGHAVDVAAVNFLPGGDRVISADINGAIIVWDLASRKIIRKLSAQRSHLRTMAVSADGETAATGDADGILRLWRIPARGDRFRFREFQTELNDLSRRAFAVSSPATVPSANPPAR